MTKQFLFIFSFLLMSQFVVAQNNINQFDVNGKRHGIWKKNFKLNNKLRYTGQFNHGKEVGVFKYYDINNDEIPIVIRKFNDVDDFAEVSFFTKKGTLLSKGKMLGKERIGKWIFYQPDGKSVLSEEFYKEGLLDGEVKVYYTNGKITEISHYLKGMLHGNYKRYAVRGFLYQDLTYNFGELDGMAIYYERKNGVILTKGLFKNNKRVGTWEHYENSKLISTDEPALKPDKTKN